MEQNIGHLADRIEAFVRNVIAPYEQDARLTAHGPGPELVAELREKARSANLMTPHIREDGSHATQRETVQLFRRAGLSTLGPLAINVAAPDEGNMYLLGRIATPPQKDRFLKRLIEGHSRSAFLMTEPASEGGAGSDPSMMKTTARLERGKWVINGRKAFITGVVGAEVGIVMARTGTTEGRVAATMFLVDLPDPAVKVERVLDTIDSSMPGGHAIISIQGLRVSADHILGELHQGFDYAQLRLAPARLSHCARWHGACTRANQIATAYALSREAFGRALIDHEGVGYMLADNLIDLKQSELMIDWCAGVLDSGARGGLESSITKTAVSEALFRVADRCVQVMGGTGLSRDTIVEQVFREIRAFRIYDGPTEAHKWSIAKHIKNKGAGL